MWQAHTRPPPFSRTTAELLLHCSSPHFPRGKLGSQLEVLLSIHVKVRQRRWCFKIHLKMEKLSFWVKIWGVQTSTENSPVLTPSGQWAGAAQQVEVILQGLEKDSPKPFQLHKQLPYSGIPRVSETWHYFSIKWLL